MPASRMSTCSRRWTTSRPAAPGCSIQCSTTCETAMTTRNPDQLSIPPDGRPYHDQPQWRNDFPIDWPQDEFVARRDFTKFLVLTSFAFVVGHAWIVLENFLRKRRGQLPVTRIAAAE